MEVVVDGLWYLWGGESIDDEEGWCLVFYVV